MYQFRYNIYNATVSNLQLHSLTTHNNMASFTVMLSFSFSNGMFRQIYILELRLLTKCWLVLTSMPPKLKSIFTFRMVMPEIMPMLTRTWPETRMRWISILKKKKRYERYNGLSIIPILINQLKL